MGRSWERNRVPVDKTARRLLQLVKNAGTVASIESWEESNVYTQEFVFETDDIGAMRQCLRGVCPLIFKQYALSKMALVELDSPNERESYLSYAAAFWNQHLDLMFVR